MWSIIVGKTYRTVLIHSPLFRQSVWRVQAVEASDHSKQVVDGIPYVFTLIYRKLFFLLQII